MRLSATTCKVCRELQAKDEQAQRISEFVKAQDVSKVAERRLNAVIQPKLKALAEAKDVDGLMALIDELPKSYRGVRRIYQAIEEIQESNDV